jgi:hypothetical protein
MHLTVPPSLSATPLNSSNKSLMKYPCYFALCRRFLTPNQLHLRLNIARTRLPVIRQQILSHCFKLYPLTPPPHPLTMMFPARNSTLHWTPSPSMRTTHRIITLINGSHPTTPMLHSQTAKSRTGALGLTL